MRKSFPLAVSAAHLIMSPFVCSVEGRENVPDIEPCVVAANHTSFLDGILLATVFAFQQFRPLHMISFEAPFRHWLLGWFLRSGRSLSIRRGDRESSRALMRRSLGYLRMGESVGIFPEGHINQSDVLRRARPGAVLLALESGAPILPVGIVGAREVLPLGARRPVLRCCIRICIGKPIPMAEEHAKYCVAQGRIGWRSLPGICGI